jgi:hypothetical protein
MIIDKTPSSKLANSQHHGSSPSHIPERRQNAQIEVVERKGDTGSIQMLGSGTAPDFVYNFV